MTGAPKLVVTLNIREKTKKNEFSALIDKNNDCNNKLIGEITEKHIYMFLVCILVHLSFFKIASTFMFLYELNSSINVVNCVI